MKFLQLIHFLTNPNHLKTSSYLIIISLELPDQKEEEVKVMVWIQGDFPSNFVGNLNQIMVILNLGEAFTPRVNSKEVFKVLKFIKTKVLLNLMGSFLKRFQMFTKDIL